jgi:hypothetical protein
MGRNAILYTMEGDHRLPVPAALKVSDEAVHELTAHLGGQIDDGASS